MTIYFNSSYDSSVFLTTADCGLGKSYFGKEALLSELELRAGLTQSNTDHAYRVIAYMAAMKVVLKNARAEGKELFFAESFERDDFGTADLMLGWRDSLVKAGWNGQKVGDSLKIAVLSLIESSFDCPGPADRWKAIIAEAGKRPILRPSDRIIVQGRKEDLEPILQHLFDSINAHYTVPVVEYQSQALPVSPENQAFVSGCRILDFEDEYAAHEWIASQDYSDIDVVAEADEALLDDLLQTLGKCGIGAADEGIGAVMQLLPQGIALFRYPADISSLQSYLQSPRTPLEKLHVQKKKQDGTLCWPGVAGVLFDHLCSEGGFGAGWETILQSARFDREGKELDVSAYKKARQFIGMWEKSKDLPAGEARIRDVESFIKGLQKWAGGNIQPDCALNAQFRSLQGNCEMMLRLLEGLGGETVPVDTLSRWANHICVPINISNDYARLGSVNVVGDVADIYSHAGQLVWFAATTENGILYEYDFLSKSEIRALRAAGALLPDKGQMSRIERSLKLEGLSRCDKVTIVTCKRISGVETVQSALLSEIADFIPAAKGAPIKKSGVGVVETDFGKKAEHRFNPGILDGFKREAESYSSINTLLMSPVDYLLDYVKGYRQYGIKEVADILSTEGTVAHAYLEILGKECGNEPRAMLAMHKSRFNTLIDTVISEKGLILRLGKNHLEEKCFRVSLKESVETLMGIIIENGLVIKGFEYPLTADIKPVGPILAIIDCLLLDPSDGKYVILDFKYNSGKTYSKKIEENRELQLAIYRKVVEKELGEVKFIGYYAIPRKELFTPSNSLKDNPAVEEVSQEAVKDIFGMAARGFVFRWTQLRQGILEEGEGLPIADLAYSSQPDLYPLEPDYDHPDQKKHAYGDKNIVLKGGLK